MNELVVGQRVDVIPAWRGTLVGKVTRETETLDLNKTWRTPDLDSNEHRFKSHINKQHIQEYKLKNKVTVLLASHNMSEVERLCDSIIMMKNGNIIDKGTCEELIKKHGRNNLEETFLKLVRSKDEF